MRGNKHPERLTAEEYNLPTTSFHIFKNTIHKKIELHWHEFYEMSFVIDGEGIHVMNGTAYPLQKGSLFLLTPSDFHEIIPDTERKLEKYTLIFSEDLLDDKLYSLLFNDIHTDSCLFTGTEYAQMEADFQRLLEEMYDSQVGHKLAIEYTLSRILIDVARKRMHSEKKTEVPDVYQPFRDALIFIHHHFRESITLEDAAKQAGLSSSYFSNRFGQITGCSFQVYLQELRLQFAKSLLHVSDLTVTDICLASGFNTLSHFERSFKRKYGLSPRLYRMQPPVSAGTN